MRFFKRALYSLPLALVVLVGYARQAHATTAKQWYWKDLVLFADCTYTCTVNADPCNCFR